MGKAFYGTKGEQKLACKLDFVSCNDFPFQLFGRVLADHQKVREWQTKAKKEYIDSKGKAGMASVKKWIKENNPSQFYILWKESNFYKDDTLQIYYTD